MKIDILTLFPKMFEGILEESIIKRAIEKGLVEINIIDFREFSHLSNHQVDDTPYGGGSGMVLRCEPLVEAIESVKTMDSKVLLMCPQGVPYKEKKAIELSKEKHLIFVCGHYEGYDERIRAFVDEEIIQDINERMMQKVFHDLLGADIQLPLPRMTYAEAMERYGSDKPDVRFGME